MSKQCNVIPMQMLKQDSLEYNSRVEHKHVNLPVPLLNTAVINCKQDSLEYNLRVEHKHVNLSTPLISTAVIHCK